MRFLPSKNHPDENRDPGRLCLTGYRLSPVWKYIKA
jgi:hypothetical protein